MRHIILLACMLCWAASVAVAEPKLELVVQTGHSGRLSSVSLSENGLGLTGGERDQSAILWDADSGQQLRVLLGHKHYVTSVSLSGDGHLALTGSEDKTAILWDVKTGNALRTLEGHSKAVGSVCLSRDGRLALTGSWDKTAIVWDASTGTKLQTLRGHTDMVISASLSGDGRLALTSAAINDKTVILWDAKTGKKLLTFKAETALTSVSLSHDGTRALTGSGKTAILWDTMSGEKLRTLERHSNSVVGVALSGDGRTALTGSWDKTVILWDATAGKPIQVFEGHSKEVKRVALRRDGQRALTCGWDDKAISWDATTGKQLQTFQGRGSVVSLANFSGNGRYLIFGTFDRSVTIWDAEAGQLIRSLPLTFRPTVPHLVESVSLSGDGKTALTHDPNDDAALLWDVGTGRQSRKLRVPGYPVHRASLSTDGKLAITVGSGDIVLWDVEGGKPLHYIRGNSGRDVCLSANGKVALSGSSDKLAFLWDVSTGKKLHTLTGHTEVVGRVSLNSDAKLALTGSGDKTAILWEVTSGKKLHTLAGHTEPISGVSLSGDGKLALTGSYDRTAFLWDTATGKQLFTLQGHLKGVTSANLTPDGNRALTGSYDGTARIWDTKTGKELCNLISIDKGKDWLVVTPDGYFDGSENAAKLVSFRIAGTLDFVPLERYRKQFERPGLLAMVWKGEDYKGKGAVEQDLPPTVSITSPTPNFASKDGKFTITAEAKNLGNLPVIAFRLKVNGKPFIKNQGLLDVKTPKPGKATASWDIELGPGRHTLEVLAYTKAVFSVSEQIEVKYVGGQKLEENAPPGTLYILAVGISKYPNKDHQLDFAHKDAEEVAAAYQKHSKTLFKNVEVKVLTDAKATEKGIRQGLAWLRKSTTAKDYAVFFFAGHGVKDNRDKFYLFPVDGDRDDLSSTALSDSIITEELISIPGQLVVLLDACHAGAVVNKTRSLRGMTEELLKDLSSEEKGVAIMCSASGKELAQESREHGHGMFTLALLEGIRGTGSGEAKVRLNSGAVYFKELDAYVNGRVKQLSKNQQHPVTGTPRTFRDFPVSKPQ